MSDLARVIHLVATDPDFRAALADHKTRTSGMDIDSNLFVRSPLDLDSGNTGPAKTGIDIPSQHQIFLEINV